LRELKISNDLEFLYVVRFDENNNIQYVFDIYTDRSDYELVSLLGTEAGEDVVYMDAFLEVYLSGQTLEEAIITRTGWGHLVSAYVPLLDSDGRVVAVACADVDMDALLQYVLLQTILLGAIVFIVFLFSSIIILYPYTKDLSKSREIAIERERVVTELSVAKDIQTRILPSGFNPVSKRNELDVHTYMQPQREVGGDFYDFFFISDNVVAIVIGDVSGKGVPAALFMSSTMMLIKSTAKLLAKNNEENEPQKVFNAVNSVLYEERKNIKNMFVTAFMGYLNLTNGKFTYVNAGHNPPLFKHGSGDFDFMDIDPEFVLAGLGDYEYNSHTIDLSKGDIICFYTDGITDAVNNRNEYFSDNLLDAARGYKGESAEGLVTTLLKELESFTHGVEQKDDIAMLSLKYDGEDGESMSTT
jgi:serine phosphatase RsbU (regulator of sigma subunit)